MIEVELWKHLLGMFLYFAFMIFIHHKCSKFGEWFARRVIGGKND